MKKKELIEAHQKALDIIQEQMKKIEKLEKDLNFWKTMAEEKKSCEPYTDPVPYMPTYSVNPYPWWNDHIIWCYTTNKVEDK